MQIAEASHQQENDRPRQAGVLWQDVSIWCFPRGRDVTDAEGKGIQRWIGKESRRNKKGGFSPKSVMVSKTGFVAGNPEIYAAEFCSASASRWRSLV